MNHIQIPFSGQLAHCCNTLENMLGGVFAWTRRTCSIMLCTEISVQVFIATNGSLVTFALAPNKQGFASGCLSSGCRWPWSPKLMPLAQRHSYLLNLPARTNVQLYADSFTLLGRIRTDNGFDSEKDYSKGLSKLHPSPTSHESSLGVTLVIVQPR